jgi:hypothetical protein
MERRGCGLGCIITGLGLLLSLCLLPYLVSSVYSVVSAMLQVPAAPNWLWGDWLNTLVGESDTLYMLLAEGPICCVGALGLLIIILGLVIAITSPGPAEVEVEEEYVSYEDL